MVVPNMATASTDRDESVTPSLTPLEHLKVYGMELEGLRDDMRIWREQIYTIHFYAIGLIVVALCMQNPGLLPSMAVILSSACSGYGFGYSRHIIRRYHSDRIRLQRHIDHLSQPFPLPRFGFTTTVTGNKWLFFVWMIGSANLFAYLVTYKGTPLVLPSSVRSAIAFGFVLVRYATIVLRKPPVK